MANQMKIFGVTRNVIGLAIILLTSSLMTMELHAGTIFVSGDSNITTYINNPGIGPPNDNPAFFRNVLGEGTSVSIQHTGSIFGPNSGSLSLDVFYDNIDGVSSTYVFPGEITTGSLSGIDIFFSVTPRNFTDSEVSALRSFLDWGGTLFLMADFSVAPSVVNELLISLGSSLSVIRPVQTGSQILTGTQIAADPFMEGVSRFYYNAGYSVDSNDGTGLAFDEEGNALIAYETIAVPEPATLTLILLAMLSFFHLGQRA